MSCGKKIIKTPRGELLKKKKVFFLYVFPILNNFGGTPIMDEKDQEKGAKMKNSKKFQSEIFFLSRKIWAAWKRQRAG